MSLFIPKERSFDCPEGNFACQFYGSRLVPDVAGGQQRMKIRLYFKVDAPTQPNLDIRVHRTFDPSLHHGSKLRAFLEPWLGAAFFQENSGKELALECLLGRPGEVTVVHIQNETHPKPYCLPTGIFAPGTLKLGQGFTTAAASIAPQFHQPQPCHT